MTLERAAWLFAVLTSWTVAGILFISEYQGYGWVAVAIGLTAAINLFSHPDGNEKP